jgi:hypothetical protein
VVWRSDSQDGSSAGVYGQRFNADGTPDGAEFRVNTYTANGQYQQKVAALNDGGYVVVWGSDSGQDTSGWGVYGQRYDATGAAVGGEFRVNYTVSSTQYQPAVASLENGGFVVSWADGDEIWLQQYDSSGRKVDSQQSVNADGNYGYSNTPDLVSTPDGGFIVTYGGYNYGNSSYDVFLQRFSNTAPTIQDVSVVGPEDSAIILTDELFASGFFDAEGQALAAIKVITLPASGILKLDGIDVVAGQVISVADLAANKLTYQGNLDFNGPDQFRWNGSDGNVFATTSVFTNITVNNVNDAPALEAGIDGTASEGIHFVRAITIGDPDSTDTHLVTVSWLGSGGQTGSYQFNTSAGTPSIGLTLPDDASYTVTVTANDQQGQANSIETDSFTVTVNNVAPTLPYMSGNNTVEQGQIYTLDLNGPYDYLASPVVDPGTDTVTEYRIDWGDGTAVETILAASLPANGEVTHTYAAPGTPTIHVAVVDEDGTHADAGTKSITVTPPAEVIVVDAGADAGASEGTLFSRTISFTDPADQDPAGRDVTVDWGDGTAAQNFRIATGQTSFDIQHVFADNRVTPYTVNVTVDDDGAQQDSDSFDVTVGDVAPTLFLGGNGSTPEGSAYTLTLGGVVDPGADTVSEYVVHWGDGNDQSFLVADLPANRQVQHVYNDGDVSGTDHTITVDLVNEDGTFLAAGSKPITVTNVAPSVPVSGADSTDEGATYVLTVGALTDPGLDTPTLYRINWGDGGATDDYTPAQYAALLLAGGAVSHIFADGNAGGTARNIVLQVLDEDGTHNAGGKSITVNNVAPTLALTGAASVDEGASYTLNLGAITDPGQDTVSSYAIDWGDGSPPEVLSAAQVASQSGTATHTYADGASTPTISVDLTDEDGTHLAAGSLSIAVNNVAPTIALTGAGGIDEGSVYTLTLGALVDPGTETPTSYRIDWGDGTVHNYTPAEYAALSGSTTHTYADGAATPTITVSVTDEDGTHVAGSKAITVNNVAPSAAVSGAATVDEGSAYTLTVGNVTEPGADTRTGYSIDWGDGTIDNFDPTQWATAAGNFSHTYADGGAGGTARNITVSATDEDGTFILGSKAVTVNNAAPSVVLSGNAATDEGSVYTLNLLGGDPAGANDTLSYSIDWGDGSASQNLTAAELAALSGNVAHTFVDDEDGFTNATARTVEVTVSDEDGGSTLQSKSVTVNNVAPTALLGGADSVLENTLYTLNVGAILEPGTDTRDYYEIDWGDGITQSFDEAFFQLHNGVFEHLYGPGGAVRTITMTTQDEDGEFTLGTKQVTVTLATPNLSFDAGVDTSLNEGDTFTRSIAFSDGTDNGAAGWSYSIDYGDGSAVVNGTTLVQSVDLSHLYADGAASRTVTLSLIDEAGETASDSFVVTVNNVAPTIALTGADSVNEGASYTLTLGAMTDPGTDTVTSYVVNWGDGSSDTYGAAGDVTHVYADGAATPTITVDLVDEDGTHTAAGSKAITVNNVTPLIALSGASSVDEGAAYTLTLGAVTDPGTDTVTSYVVNWGDGSSDTYAAAGDVTHVYADGLSTPDHHGRSGR